MTDAVNCDSKGAVSLDVWHSRQHVLAAGSIEKNIG